MTQRDASQSKPDRIHGERSRQRRTEGDGPQGFPSTAVMPSVSPASKDMMIMAEENTAAGEQLDPLTVLASKQEALDKRLAAMSEALQKQNEQMTELMKSNASLLAQNQALIQKADKPQPQKEEAVQDLAFNEMMKTLGIKD